MNPEELEYAWTAEVRLNGGQLIIIWYTCWPSIKRIVAEITWIASDYPKELVCSTFIIK